MRKVTQKELFQEYLKEHYNVEFGDYNKTITIKVGDLDRLFWEVLCEMCSSYNGVSVTTFMKVYAPFGATINLLLEHQENLAPFFKLQRKLLLKKHPELKY